MVIAKTGIRAIEVVDVNDNKPTLHNHQGWHSCIVSLVDAILPPIPQIPQLSSSLCSHQHLRTVSRPVPRLFFRKRCTSEVATSYPQLFMDEDSICTKA